MYIYSQLRKTKTSSIASSWNIIGWLASSLFRSQCSYYLDHRKLILIVNHSHYPVFSSCMFEYIVNLITQTSSWLSSSLSRQTVLHFSAPFMSLANKIQQNICQLKYLQAIETICEYLLL